MGKLSPTLVKQCSDPECRMYYTNLNEAVCLMEHERDPQKLVRRRLYICQDCVKEDISGWQNKKHYLKHRRSQHQNAMIGE